MKFIVVVIILKKVKGINVIINNTILLSNRITTGLIFLSFHWLQQIFSQSNVMKINLVNTRLVNHNPRNDMKIEGLFWDMAKVRWFRWLFQSALQSSILVICSITFLSITCSEYFQSKIIWVHKLIRIWIYKLKNFDYLYCNLRTRFQFIYLT